MESNLETQTREIDQEVQRQGAYKFNSFENEEIANIRVSRSCAIRLLADGEYNKKSIEALVAQLQLGLELGIYDDLDDEQEE